MREGFGPLERIVEALKKHLDLLDATRNEIMIQRQSMLRNCRKAISLIHSGKIDEAEGLLLDVISKLREIDEDARGEDTACVALRMTSIVKQEVVEGMVLLSIVRGRELPPPERIGAAAKEYLLGLADAAGELRRMVLGAIKRGDLEPARSYLDWMEAIYDPLSQLTYPNSLIPIRRKVDVMRSLLDRTLSEYLFHEKSSSMARTHES